MNTNNIDIFLIMETAKAERSAAMTDMIVDLKGVVNANVNQFVKRIVNVSYDPKVTSSSDIVATAKSKGDYVALVAM